MITLIEIEGRGGVIAANPASDRPHVELAEPLADDSGRAPSGGRAFGPLNNEIRRLLDVVALADAPDDALFAAAACLRGVREDLDPFVGGEASAAAGRRFDLPARGQLVVPPWEVLSVGSEEIRGTINFHDVYLGAGGVAHGGAVSMLFDDVLGYLASWGGGRPSIRTAYLHVEYKDLTPVNEDLTVAARVDRIEGRKIFVEGTLRHGSTICASGQGLFVTVRPEADYMST